MKFIDPGFKGTNPGHYSAAVVSHGMLYVSGQLSINPDTREPCTGGIREHAALALDFFGEHKPGRVVVSTTPLHFGCLVEIEAIAELNEE